MDNITKKIAGYASSRTFNNLDEAIGWAARCPGARAGSIEVRPVVDFSQPM